MISKFHFALNERDMSTICFSNYTKQQVVDILWSKARGKVKQPENFFRRFVEYVHSLFSFYNEDLDYMMRLVNMIYPAYIAPVLSQEVSIENTLKLNALIKPKVMEALSDMYLAEPFTLENSQKAVELPFFSRFLVVASFLASNNPASTDKRFFSTKTSKRKHTKEKNGKVCISTIFFFF